MKIAITGATGFVGTHLIKELRSKELVVIGRHIRDLPEATFFNRSIGNTTDYSKVIESVEVIVHCAARAHIMNDNALNPLSEFREINTYVY